MNLERLMPIFAPAPPAIVLGLQLYNEIIRASGQEWWFLATIAAVLGTVGTIGVEMLSYKNALKAWAEREIGAMIVALVAALVASTLIVWVIWRSEDSRPLVAAIAIAIAGYLSMAVRDFMDKKKSMRIEARNKENTAKDLEIKLAHEMRLKASADARRAKAEASGAKVSDENPKVSESFGNNWRRVPEVERAKIAQMNTKQISETYRVSERTALNWQTYAKEK